MVRALEGGGGEVQVKKSQWLRLHAELSLSKAIEEVQQPYGKATDGDLREAADNNKTMFLHLVPLRSTVSVRKVHNSNFSYK